MIIIIYALSMVIIGIIIAIIIENKKEIRRTKKRIKESSRGWANGIISYEPTDYHKSSFQKIYDQKKRKSGKSGG